MRDLNPGIAKAFLSLAGNHYPERLGTKIVLGAPGIFSAFWSVVKPFVDPVSQRKMRFWPYKPDLLREKMKELFDDETANVGPTPPWTSEWADSDAHVPPPFQWLLTEMAENRKKGAIKAKIYEVPGKGCEFRPPHDCRGTKSFLDKMAVNGMRYNLENQVHLRDPVVAANLPRTGAPAGPNAK